MFALGEFWYHNRLDLSCNFFSTVYPDSDGFGSDWDLNSVHRVCKPTQLVLEKEQERMAAVGFFVGDNHKDQSFCVLLTPRTDMCTPSNMLHHSWTTVCSTPPCVSAKAK